MVKVYYQGSTGLIVDFQSKNYKMHKVTDLLSYKWEYTNSEYVKRIESFDMKFIERSFTVSILAGNRTDYQKAVKNINDIFERDIKTLSPGKLYIGDSYLSCYIVEGKTERFDYHRNRVDKTYTLIAEKGQWIKETKYSFSALTEDEITSDLTLKACKFTNINRNYVDTRKTMSARGSYLSLTDIAPAEDDKIIIHGKTLQEGIPTSTVPVEIKNVGVPLGAEDYYIRVTINGENFSRSCSTIMAEPLVEGNVLVMFGNGVLKYIKRTGRIILDGTEDWEKDWITGNWICDCIKSMAKKSSTNIISTHFESPNIYVNAEGMLSIIYEECSSAIAFKEWLQENPVTVEYELAEPEIIYLDNTDGFALSVPETSIMYHLSEEERTKSLVAELEVLYTSNSSRVKKEKNGVTVAIEKNGKVTFIGEASAYTEIFVGHVHLRKISYILSVQHVAEPEKYGYIIRDESGNVVTKFDEYQEFDCEHDGKFSLYAYIEQDISFENECEYTPCVMNATSIYPTIFVPNRYKIRIKSGDEVVRTIGITETSPDIIFVPDVGDANSCECEFDFLAEGVLVNPFNYEFVDYDAAVALDFPYDFKYDLSSGRISRYVVNTNIDDADFIMKIFGACYNPKVSAGENIYRVKTDIYTGEYLEINSVTKKVTKYKVNGEKINCFNLRDRENYIFEKIKPGLQKLNRNGTFAVELTLLEYRSEPEWWI